MPFGQKYFSGLDKDMKHKNKPDLPSYDKTEAVKKVKDYNQVRNEVMGSKDQIVANFSQVVSKLKQPLPKLKLGKKQFFFISLCIHVQWSKQLPTL